MVPFAVVGVFTHNHQKAPLFPYLNEDVHFKLVGDNTDKGSRFQCMLVKTPTWAER